VLSGAADDGLVAGTEADLAGRRMILAALRRRPLRCQAP